MSYNYQSRMRRGDDQQAAAVIGVGQYHIDRNESILYVVSYAITIIGLWTVWFSLEQQVAALFFIAGVTCGFLTSIAMRYYRRSIMGNILCFGGALLFWGVLSSNMPNLPELLEPVFLQMADVSRGMSILLGFMVVAMSFFLVSRAVLIFSVVPVLAIFGLLATMLDPRIIIAFLLFLLASIFLLSYANTLDLKEDTGLQLPRFAQKQLGQDQVIISSVFFVAVLVIAVTLTMILMAILSRSTVTKIVEAINRINDPTTAVQTQRRQQNPPSINFSRSDFPVGQGPITPGNGIIMYVTSNSAELWRESVYDFYTGQGWNTAKGTKPQELDLKNGAVTFPIANGNEQSYRRTEQEFKLAIPFRGPLPAAAQPVWFKIMSINPPPKVELDRFGCFSVPDRQSIPGAIYQVVSMLPRATGAPIATSLMKSERDAYLQFPWQARRIRELVADIVPANAAPMDKARLLQNYLGSGRYTYSLQATAVPRDEDAASYFLFDSKTGYCDLFATAFAMMCRAAGIPSRIAVGYAEGTPSTEKENTFIVKESDAHAWVEIFIPARGWITMDPTPPGQEEVAQREARRRTAPWLVALWRMRISLTFLALALIVAFFLVKIVWLDPWWQRRRWEKLMGTSTTGQITIVYAQMCRLLARRGLLRQPWQTPFEFLATLSGPGAFIGAALAPARELTNLFVRARYGRSQLDSKHIAAARESLQRFRQSLRQHTVLPAIPTPEAGSEASAT
jgi:hypothetical protein